MLSPSSVWNQKLPDDAPIDSQSSVYVASLVKTVEEVGISLSYEGYGLGIFWANEATPRQKVWIDAKDEFATKLRGAFAEVPIPPEFRPPGPFPGDQIACICVPKADGTLEYFEGHRWRYIPIDPPETGITGCTTLEKPGWHVNAGAAIKDLHTNPGWTRESDWPGGIDAGTPWACSASRLLLYPHVIKIAEAQRGVIPHALRIDMPTTGHQKAFRWPALASDGTSEDPTKPPNGTIFRFDPDDELSDVANPIAKMIAVALREYGAIQTDSAADVAFKAECQATVRGSESFGIDAWKGPLHTIGSAGALLSTFGTTLMKEIPLSRLKVVGESYRPSEVVHPTIIG